MKRMTGWMTGAWLALVLALAACAAPQAAGGDTAASLAGTSWRLTELNGQAPVPGVTVPTLEFAAGEARASGNAGCNQYNGPYTQNGPSLRFGPLASTRRACTSEAGNAQETAYLRALESTTRFTLSGGVLVLYAGNQPVARFAANGG